MTLNLTRAPLKKQKIAILGVGLLGGSLALALKKNKGIQLVGWSRRASSRREASRILRMVPTLTEAVKGAQTVVVCTHSGQVTETLPLIAGGADPDALILDVSSAKVEIARSASLIPWASRHFVPCHPMAGKEKSGVKHADGNLYRNKIVFITPLKGNPPALVRQAAAFWKKTGGLPIFLTPARHDRFVALTSHLPHLLGALLVHLYGAAQKRDPSIQKAVGTGFRDFTRIAAGNPSMWEDIVRMNRGEILFFLRQYQKGLSVLER